MSILDPDGSSFYLDTQVSLETLSKDVAAFPALITT